MMRGALEFDLSWKPSANIQIISTVDTHTAGEPLRVILAGLPDLGDGTVLEKRQKFLAEYDHLREGLLLEPRGHSDMYGAIVTSNKDQRGMDVFFINTKGYSGMCGHGILALAVLTFNTTLLGRHDLKTQQIFNTPAGPVNAGIKTVGGVSDEVYFDNVPSFAYLMDLDIEVLGLGTVKFDISFGGAFFAYVDAAQFGVKLKISSSRELIEIAQSVKAAISASRNIEHPYERALNGLFGVIFVADALNAQNHSRNVNIYEESGIDRSPTGTGISARCALMMARGDLKRGQRITVESIIGSEMSVEAIEETHFGEYDAIVPRVSGKAYLTGRHELFFDPVDPYRQGFVAR